MHHRFLYNHKYAINIITMDISKRLGEVLQNQTHKKFGIPRTQEEFLTYWMRHLSFAGNEECDTSGNVFIVLTHKDEVSAPHFRPIFLNFISEIQDILKKNNFARFWEAKIIAVSNGPDSGSENDSSRLRGELYTMVSHHRVPSGAKMSLLWGFRFPTRWLGLKAKIFDSNLTQIKLSKVEELAKPFEMQQADVNAFLNFHHITGDLIWLSETPNSLVVQKPQWLLDALKAIITTPQFIQDLPEEARSLLSTGRISRQGLKKLWESQPGLRYFWWGATEENIESLIELMQIHDLIIPLDSHHAQQMYLVHCMVQNEDVPPENTEPRHTMRPIYRSEYCWTLGGQFPIGTFSRLIGRLYKLTKWPVDETLQFSSRYVSFHINKQILLTLFHKLIDVIEVSVWIDPYRVKGNPQDELRQVKAQLSLLHDELDFPRCTKFSMLCPFWSPEGWNETHPLCVVDVEENKEREEEKQIWDSAAGGTKPRYGTWRGHREVFHKQFPAPRTGLFSELRLFLSCAGKKMKLMAVHCAHFCLTRFCLSQEAIPAKEAGKVTKL